jgi:hypothetical protein
MATPINAIGFEGYGPTVYNGTIGATGQPEYDEAGEEKMEGDNPLRYFYFVGESNSSTVTNEAASSKRTAHFTTTGAANVNYLALDTEGGTLWRSINKITEGSGTYGLGIATNVAPAGTYLDTLVQFTVTEDEAPTVGADDKLAIWLQAGEGTTNLMVKAGYYNASGTFVNEGTNFVVSGVTVTPGTWYRLTVKAIDDVVNSASEFASFYKLPVFTIQIDGTYMTASEATLPSEYTSGLAASSILTSDTVSEFNNGKYFLSLKMGTPGAATTLQGVGFQGTGAVDEIVWTEDNPFPAASPIDFTLTWTAAEVSAVSYVLSTDLTTTNSLTSGTAVQLTPGDGAATIELIPTFETGYEFDKVTMGETDLSTLTFPIPSATATATLVAKAIPVTYPSYIDTTDATIKGKYDAWKQAVGFDDSSTSTHLNQFLLNVDEETTVGDAALEITEIKQNATAGWDITIGCTLDGVRLTGEVNSTIVCNGYLAVSYTDNLTGTWTTENIAVTAVDATTGTVTVNVNKANAKFMKVTLTAAPQPAANN